MSKWARSARVRRVSSHAITAASLRVRSARRVMSSRLPIGVATTKRVPRGLRLGGLFLGFGHEERPLAIQDDLPRDDALLEPLDRRELVHDLEHDFLEDRAEAACARAALEGFLRDRRDRILGELEAHLLEIEVLLYCLTIAFFGSLRIRTSAGSSRSWSGAMIGSRPTNSGMRPYFSRSSGWIIARRSPTRRSSRLLMSAPKPMPDRPTRDSMIFSSPTNAPPQRKSTFEVSTWMNSWWGCLRPPCGGTFATVPSRILSSACWTPSPETSRVIEGFSDFRAILSISSM